MSEYTNNIWSNIRSLDLVFFRGSDYVSDLIRYVEGRKLCNTGKFKIQPDAFSHVGIIVKSDILDDPRLDDDKVYIWESTMSGILNDGVTNIDGRSFLGVQLRDFHEVVEKYGSIPDTKIAIAPLDESYRELLNEIERENEISIKEAFTNLFNDLNGTFYDVNPVSLFSSIFKRCRMCRSNSEKFWKTENYLFCSELVATIYRHMGIFPYSVNPKNVVPMDFLGFDDDTLENGGIPVVLDDLYYLVE